jgi:hypothetical protein
MGGHGLGALLFVDFFDHLCCGHQTHVAERKHFYTAISCHESLYGKVPARRNLVSPCSAFCASLENSV